MTTIGLLCFGLAWYLAKAPSKSTDGSIEEVARPIEEVDRPMEEADDPMEEADDPMEEADDPMEEAEGPIKEVDGPFKEGEYPERLPNLDNPPSQTTYEEESELYEIAFSELQEDKKYVADWARAFAEAEGNEEKTKALYIKFRVISLSTEFEKSKQLDKKNERDRIAKEEEERRQQEYAARQTAQQILEEQHQEIREKFNLQDFLPYLWEFQYAGDDFSELENSRSIPEGLKIILNVEVEKFERVLNDFAPEIPHSKSTAMLLFLETASLHSPLLLTAGDAIRVKKEKILLELFNDNNLATISAVSHPTVLKEFMQLRRDKRFPPTALNSTAHKQCALYYLNDTWGLRTLEETFNRINQIRKSYSG